MTDPAVISGDFSTFRHVQGRRVLQIVIEVPAEAAGSVFAKLGIPGSGEGIPVAVARLQTASEPIAKPESPKERRPFSELPYSQQAAMRSEEGEFARFLSFAYTDDWRKAAQEAGSPGVKWAPIAVRRICGVQSRADITNGTPAGDKWADLEAEYYAWQRGMR